MENLFGLQMSYLAWGLIAALAVLVAAVIAIGVSNRFLIRLSLRNIPRRKPQTVLIIVGLMLATTIFSASFAVGDTITVSIREAVIEGIGDTDIVVRKPGEGTFARPTLDAEEIDGVIALLEGENTVNGVMPTATLTLPVLNERTGRTEARTFVRGYHVDGLYGTIDLPPGPQPQPFWIADVVDGSSNDMRTLADDQVFINIFLQEELDAIVGDTLTVYSPTGPQEFTVAAVLDRGGIASADNRLMLPLAAFNRIAGSPADSADRVDISLDTDRYDLEDASGDLRQKLAVALVDREALNFLFGELSSNVAFVAAIDQYVDAESGTGGELSSDDADDLREISASLKARRPDDRFIELITRFQTLGLIFNAVSAFPDPSFGELTQLLAFAAPQLTALEVTEIKVDGVVIADLVGNIFVTFFTFFGSFTVIVGLLLVFLIFVLLASERMQEMGISRAVGLRRGHLVQMFTLEGLAYAIGAALVGTGVGIVASRFLVELMSNAFGNTGGENFIWHFTITQWSLIISFALGLVLTFITVIYSATRVSRLNIVVAIRDLPEEFAASQTPGIFRRILNFILWIFGPIYAIWLLVRRIRQGQDVGSGVLILVSTLLVVGWAIGVLFSFVRIFTPYLRQGWPIAIVGALVAWVPFALEDGPLANSGEIAYLGASFAILGVGEMLRWILMSIGVREARAARVSFTLVGLTLLIIWALPSRFVEPVTGELNLGIGGFILAGVWMVASAVWIVMYNSDLLVNALSTSLGRFGRVRPILKPAVAYATYNRFRTGLTVSMFALVIFVMMAFSVLNNAFGNLTANPEIVSGGWDIRAEIEPDLAIDDLPARIDQSPSLNAADFDVVAGQSDEFTSARQIGAENPQFFFMTVRGSEPGYFQRNELRIQDADPAYLPAGVDLDDETGLSRAVWDALASDPSLAVLTDEHFPVTDDFGGGGGFGDELLEVEGYSIGADNDFVAFDVEFVGAAAAAGGSRDTVTRTVIGVTELNADSLEGGTGQGPPLGFIGMHTRHDVFNELHGEPAPFTVYRIRLQPGADVAEVSARMETVFIQNSLVAVDTLDEITASQDANRQFNLLFQGFMGLGLVVGAASVGVIAMRAVNERRKHIAIMRAIGYKALMVRVGFAVESIFVAVVGTILGVALGAIISWSFIDDISGEAQGLEFGIPWFNVSVVVGITIIASLLTTAWPARQASKIAPAEALRFE